MVSAASSRFDQSDEYAISQLVLRLAELWQLTDPEVGAIVGVPASWIEQLRSGERQLNSCGKFFENGRILLRVFLALDAWLGCDDAAIRSWLRASNKDLSAAPIDIMVQANGLASMESYVGGLRHSR